MSRAGAAPLLVLQMLLAPVAVAAQPVAVTPSCGAMLGPHAREVERDGITLAWRARPHPLPLNRHFELDIVVCGGSVDALRVDADMPAHRHGMNYRATVENTGPARYVARGLLLHMPGRWRLIFDAERGGQQLRMTDELELP